MWKRSWDIVSERAFVPVSRTTGTTTVINLHALCAYVLLRIGIWNMRWKAQWFFIAFDYTTMSVGKWNTHNYRTSVDVFVDVCVCVNLNQPPKPNGFRIHCVRSGTDFIMFFIEEENQLGKDGSGAYRRDSNKSQLSSGAAACITASLKQFMW